ncbi:hypothetical protein BKA23_2161 [Rudaeicoccus suwonensis]|uniref:Uncharacterized protein n=2 Tax=Rudaeicoccus suwonensis TaxID=657409 RepID=A0A561ECJ1_9MICO|nr:hypothetical protein BKA23_2161 [Rudaeicoccus suwonensis]
MSFADFLAVYDLSFHGAQVLVSAATDLLVLGIDCPVVVAVASAIITPETNRFVIDDLVRDARAELGLAQLDDDALIIRVAQSQLRRWAAGVMSDRELAAWAHKVIGHDGPFVLQALVNADDEFDDVDNSWTTLADAYVHSGLLDTASNIFALADPWEMNRVR